MTCNILIHRRRSRHPSAARQPRRPGRSGADGMLVDPAVMRAPIVWLASKGPMAGTVNGLLADCGMKMRQRMKRRRAVQLPLVLGIEFKHLTLLKMLSSVPPRGRRSKIYRRKDLKLGRC